MKQCGKRLISCGLDLQGDLNRPESEVDLKHLNV